MRARGIAFVTSAIGLAATLMISPRARADECTEAAPPTSAQKIFDALTKDPSPDGCTVSDLRTDRSWITLVWTKGGVRQAAVRPSSGAWTVRRWSLVAMGT